MWRTAIAQRIERGAFASAGARLASSLWATVASSGLARPLRVPAGADVVTVGGATLGGSWKTPLAVACVRALARRSLKVALVGHAYRAQPGRARQVGSCDPMPEVGDEALACAEELNDLADVSVVVGPSRQEAFDFARSSADVCVFDGPLQLRPRRASLSLLAVDASHPWGVGECPPHGDLRAPASSLVAACDAIVAVGSGSLSPALVRLSRPVYRAAAVMGWVHRSGDRLPLSALASRRIGLWTSIARPSRLEHELRAHGIHPTVALHGGDHLGPSLRQRTQARDAGVDVWLCTTKCYMHVGDELEGRPVFALRLDLELQSELLAMLEQRPRPLDPAPASP